jgi:seryl-tRNA synthetase
LGQIEQFLFTKPEDSWAALDSMLETAEAFYQSLGLAYRVVTIVSGALNNAAAKKYDLEAWFPHQGEYKELVSCSNCTDYQTRELEVRYGQKKGAIDSRKTYAHALNGTLCATSRTLCCLLENYQTEDGFRVPDALLPFMPRNTPEIIPYERELPKDTAGSKANKGAKAEGAGAKGGEKKSQGLAAGVKAAADAVADKLKNTDLKS